MMRVRIMGGVSGAVPAFTVRKSRFRIATLLWLMACAACFFGGRYCHRAGDYWNRMAVPLADHAMQILAGRSGVINSPFRVTRVETDDATIASVSPLTTESFSVAAHRAGKTTVRTWGPVPSDTATWEIEVRSP